MACAGQVCESLHTQEALAEPYAVNRRMWWEVSAEFWRRREPNDWKKERSEDSVQLIPRGTHTSCETCMQVKKQRLESDMEKRTGSKLGKEYIKAVYCHPAYLTYIEYIM